MKSFESWLFDEVETVFGIEKIEDSVLLNNWISSKKEIDDFEKRQIDILKSLLRTNVNGWNEDELKMQFIGPLLIVVNFNTPRYKAFTQRSLTLKTDKVETSGLVDFMLATGKSRPQEPFFFLHEYKQQHPSKKNDPLGQLLIAMVVAQSKNNKPHTVYGVLVEGRSWYFVVLNETKYAVSKLFDACENDVYQIYSILCKVKDYIQEILEK